MANDISQLDILQSLADIYYSMHLVDLKENTVRAYSARNQVKEMVTGSAGADKMMVQIMRATIVEEMLDEALSFSDLTTVRDRMQGKKIITKELHGKNIGWISASIITVDADEEGKPVRILFTTRSIDDLKKKEELLINASNTDELTGFLNRRAYEDNLREYNDTASEENFVYVSLDVNGLKVVNDTLGHAAGDELLIGAAECMKRCLGPYGRLYRTGGDEFAAIIFASDAEIESIKKDLEDATINWSGKYIDGISIASGFVARKDTEERSVTKIAQIADKKMYEEKALYYQKKGIDRRGQKDAHAALCALYTKILKINLTDDSYSIVNMDESEQVAEKGFSDKISSWLYNFGTSGQVHEDDLSEYLKRTNSNYIIDYFDHSKTSLHIFYRRKYEDGYKQVLMEIIPAKDYSDTNKSFYLYVKDIDR